MARHLDTVLGFDLFVDILKGTAGLFAPGREANAMRLFRSVIRILTDNHHLNVLKCG